MSWIGFLLLLLATICTSLALFFSSLKYKTNQQAYIAHSRNANIYSLIALLGAAGVLLASFLLNDFSLEYVLNNSARSLPTIYKISALWAGQSGSLLLWVLIISILMIFMQKKAQEQQQDLDLALNFILNLIRLLFLVLLLFVSPPFKRSAFVPYDGNGLNPMLQSLGMVVHPPLLFLGYSGFMIPFALAIVGIWKKDSESSWIPAMRPWILFSWLFLTAGIVTGGHWAYTELGWGGYWAWDPVENSSLFPWLTATALIHSLLLPKSYKPKTLWCYALTTGTFILTIFSSFLTRSGVLDSVHAFAGGILGWIFLGFLVTTIILVVTVAFTRRELLIFPEDTEQVGWLNQKNNLILGNLLFLLLLIVVLFGTMFPIISQLIVGREIVLDEGFYNQVSVPLFLSLAFLLGISPLLSMTKAKIKSWSLNLFAPLLCACTVGVWLFLGKSTGFLPALSFALAVFAIGTHLTGLLKPRSQRQFGAYLIHLGFILMLVGATGSSVFTEETFVSVQPGDQIQLGDYTLEYEALQTRYAAKYYTVGTSLNVLKSDKQIGQLTSEKTFWENRKQPSTKVGIRSTLKEDLYFNLAGWDNPHAQLHILRFPLVSWIWIGSWVIYLGVIILLLGSKKQVSA